MRFIVLKMLLQPTRRVTVPPDINDHQDKKEFMGKNVSSKKKIFALIKQVYYNRYVPR